MAEAQTRQNIQLSNRRLQPLFSLYFGRPGGLVVLASPTHGPTSGSNNTTIPGAQASVTFRDILW